MSPTDTASTGAVGLALFVTICAIVMVLIPFILGLRASLRAFSVTKRIDDRDIERALKHERGEAGEPVSVQVLRVLRSSLRESQGHDRMPTAFLVDASARLGLAVEVVAERAEAVGRGRLRESFDLAVCRALAPMPVLAELCLPLVRTGGRVVAWKKRDEKVEAEVLVSGRAVSILGGRRLRPIPVDLPGLPPDRQLVMLAKERPCPPRYPRLPGVPEHQPLV